MSEKDELQVRKFGEFISCSNWQSSDNSFGLKIQDKFHVPKIKSKFDFKKRKTYNPPLDVLWMKKDFFWSFLIGFIDGDGSIFWSSNRLYLSIKCHISWFDVLQQIGSRFNPVIKPHDSEGYAEIRTSRKSVLDFLYQKGCKLYLPFLERKWKLVHRRNKYEQKKRRA